MAVTLLLVARLSAGPEPPDKSFHLLKNWQMLVAVETLGFDFRVPDMTATGRAVVVSI